MVGGSYRAHAISTPSLYLVRKHARDFQPHVHLTATIVNVVVVVVVPGVRLDERKRVLAASTDGQAVAESCLQWNNYRIPFACTAVLCTVVVFDVDVGDRCTFFFPL